jgi:hypothetical protein
MILPILFPIFPSESDKTALVTFLSAALRHKCIVVLFVCLAAGCRPGAMRRPSAAVVINEVLVSNKFTNYDENRESADWIEIKNAGNRAVSLEGYSLSDDVHRTRKWSFPRLVLAPGEYALVWCTGDDSRPTVQETREEPSLYANFRLRAKETLLLSAPDGTVIDAVLIPPQTSDRSFGRAPDGTGEFRYHLRPSPGRDYRPPTSATPMPSRLELSPPGGKYREPVSVRITWPSIPGLSIRYTTDGSTPTLASRTYESPLAVQAGVEAGIVIRAAAFYGDEPVTPVETHSYFLNANSLELPILSVTMDPFEFRQAHLDQEARGRTAEHEGHLEVLSADGRREAATGMGLRLHGGMGRTGSLGVKKSYRIYFRDEYGSGKLRYSVIPESALRAFDVLVLRANYGDSLRTGAGASFVRDSVIRSLHAQMGSPAARGSWYNLFVNMEYRGLFNVVERIDKRFLASRSPQWSGEWDLIKEGTASDGDRKAWHELLRFVSDHDLRDDANYQRATEMLDAVAFAQYMILNIWAQNHDWPHVNYYASRPRRTRGRWTFLVWDAEAGLGRGAGGGFEADTLKHVYRLRSAPVAGLFVSLMENIQFRELFLKEAERQLDSVLLPENVRGHIRRLRDRIAPDVLEDLQRIFPDLEDTAVWEAAIRDLETFADERPAFVRAMLFDSPRFAAREGSSP